MPVENTTTNNAFRYPTAANDGVDFAQGIADLASDVDGMWLHGTLAARPVASVRGRVYYATDTGTFFEDTGAAWVALCPLDGSSHVPLANLSGITYSQLSASAGIVLGQLATGVARMSVVASGAGSVNVFDGQLLCLTSTGQTVHLPPVAQGAMVGVFANSAVSGSNFHVITSAGGAAAINCVGQLGSVPTIALGTPGAAVLLYSDGGSWFIIAGQKDSGWVPLTLNADWAAFSGYYTPSVRLQGDTVRLKGALEFATGGGNIATLPGGFWPSDASGVILPVGTPATGTWALTVTAAGVMSIATVSGGPPSNGQGFYLDGITWTTS